MLARTMLGDVTARLHHSTRWKKPVALALVDDPSRGETGKGGGSPWVRVEVRGG